MTIAPDHAVRRSALFGWLWSVAVLGLGLWVSLATGEWIALLCAAGLVILPIGGLALRARRP
ncbi:MULTISPECIES: hypothetical protein [unclassified Cryobacterium]|uniref:hypothetical protein n=1 Tax=unclassified Cryobacterium TaxID=2649013 RepID=UPI0010691731|nr:MULTISPECIES: hypothetical protein [unclassified Cryobacterium]TFC58655.1 hypothetical protein E3O68_01530 [Cryobacterium sp. TMB3-1-2]TFC61729.1 hypothetical protein E3O60_04110 [Cryobacterium sp. TMB1-7]TFC67076.1 hypothetical protein E3T21_16390 [Cryobacterium sp. TMB3-15]TFC73411.1 hypothetical protein E3T22_17665 [Cryobacterium sp. TMB3-10]TFC86509.1 hypothetical protein E3T19_14480 [Cryobacterium sp. TMT4-31]